MPKKTLPRLPVPCQISAKSGVSPIDAGYGLVHADTIVATTVDELRATPADARLALTVNGKTTAGRVAALGLGAGQYCGKLRVTRGRAVLTEKKINLLLVDAARLVRRFGARYGVLGYDLPVIAGREFHGGGEPKVPWSALWKTGACPDIVVDFNAPYKFVLWRGMAYAPSWTMNNVMTSNFFAETLEPGVFRDCCEMMSDRECRYSHARLIHSSAARAVIHWRYALCDSAYAICRDYWADEMFYIYPDGVAARNVTLYLDPRDEAVWQAAPRAGRQAPCSMINGPPGKRTFNDMEFISVNAPGTSAEDNLPREALTLLDGRKFARNFRWPNPPDFARAPLPALEAYIFRMNYRNRPGVFLASPPAGLQVRLQSNTGMRYEAGARAADDRWTSVPNLPGIFSDYIHWPITRGYGTTPLTDPRQYLDRPTHTFLGFANNAPVEVRADGAVTWSWLCGMAPADDAALRGMVMGWLAAPAIAGAQYNARERAYVVARLDGQLTLTTPKNQAVRNPTFRLPGREAAALAVRINGARLAEDKLAVGVERNLDMSHTVVTLGLTIPPASAIRLEAKET